MPYGYTGQNTPNQLARNTGLLDINDAYNLTKTGKLGGSLELLKEENVSGATQVLFTDLKTNDYDVHYVTVTDFVPSTSTDLKVTLYSGATEYTSGYEYCNQYGTTSGSFNRDVTTTGTYFRSTFVTSNTASSYLYFSDLGKARNTNMIVHGWANVGTLYMFYGSQIQKTQVAMDKIRFYVSAGTFSTDIKLYGIKNI